MADIRKHQKYNQAFIRVINAIIEKGLAKNKRQIAIRLGVGHQRLYFPMQGRHRPSTSLIDALVQTFDVNPACFFIEGVELFKGPSKVSKQLGDGIEKALEVTALKGEVKKYSDALANIKTDILKFLESETKYAFSASGEYSRGGNEESSAEYNGKASAFLEVIEFINQQANK